MDSMRVLGCSRCRYSAKGCSRCKKPTFTHRGPRAQPSGGHHSGGAAGAGHTSSHSGRPARSPRREEPPARQKNDPPRTHRVRKPRPLQIEPGAEHSDLYMAVAHELQQLEALQQDLSSMQHRKRSRQEEGVLDGAAATSNGNMVAKRLRTALQGPAAGQAAAAEDPQHQQQQQPRVKQEEGSGSEQDEDADMPDAPAAGSDAAHADGTGAGAGAGPQGSSFAATLEARVKQQLAEGRRPVSSAPAGKQAPKGSQDAPGADGAADAAAAAEEAEKTHASKVKAEADLAALAAELGVLAASVSDGAASGDSGGAARSPKKHPQQRRSSSSDGTPPPSAGAAAGAAASPGASDLSGAAAAAASPDTSPGCDGKPRARRSSAPKAKAYAHLALPGVDPRQPVPGWEAPASPFGLLEEELWQSPWKLLLGCMLLNKTSGKQVRRVFWKLLELCPTPEAAVAADTAAIRDIIAPLGLHNKRAVAVQRLSQDYLQKEWTCPTELYGIGKYAADAYYIFCRGQWEGVQPDDKDLIKYHEWLRSTGGQGMALEPAETAVAAATAEATAAMAEAAPPGSKSPAAATDGDAAEADAPSLDAAAAEADAAAGSGADAAAGSGSDAAAAEGQAATAAAVGGAKGSVAAAAGTGDAAEDKAVPEAELSADEEPAGAAAAADAAAAPKEQPSDDGSD